MSVESKPAVFPTNAEIERAIPNGKLPYIEAREVLFLDSATKTFDGRIIHLGNALQNLAAKSASGELDPPLSYELSQLLHHAATSFDSATAYNLNHTDRLDGSSTQRHEVLYSTRLLLHSIVDHGRQG